MKQKILTITAFFVLISCSSKTDKQENGNKENSVQNVDNSIVQTAGADKTIEYSEIESDSNEIPLNGKFLFDVAFAEWQGKSRGVKVTVIIQGDSAKVIYEGQGEFTAEIGEVLDQGIIMKHKSGEWIIGSEASDKELDEVGGCTGGPAIIDFKNKKYWMC